MGGLGKAEEGGVIRSGAVHCKANQKKTKRRSRHLEITLLLGYSVHGGLRETQKKGRVEASLYTIFSPEEGNQTAYLPPAGTSHRLRGGGFS